MEGDADRDEEFEVSNAYDQETTTKLAATVQDQVTEFSDELYSAEYAVYHFFKEHHESEAQKHLNDLSTLKTLVEDVLRRKVADNYKVFMHATREIQNMSTDMNELKDILRSTKAVLDELQQVQLKGVGAQKRSRDLYAAAEKADAGRNTIASKIPTWVMKAPTEVEKLINEQQYTKAVKLIERVRNYVTAVAGAVDLGVTVESVVKRVDAQAATLTTQIQKNIQSMTCSSIWGLAEQRKQLRLLVQLGYADVAAELFAVSQIEFVRKSMRFLEASGDPVSYADVHSQAFFSALEETCHSFKRLFADEGKEEEKKSYAHTQLILWVSTELKMFIDILSKQLRLGAQEMSSEMLEYHRSITDRAAHAQISAPVEVIHEESSSKDQETVSGQSKKQVHAEESQGKAGTGRPRKQSMDKLLQRLKNTDAFGTSSNVANPSTSTSRIQGREDKLEISVAPLTSKKSFTLAEPVSPLSPRGIGRELQQKEQPTSVVEGPLLFITRVCRTAYQYADKIDQLGLHVTSLLGWMLMPELVALMEQHVELCSTEMVMQIESDSWSNVACACPVIRPPPSTVQEAVTADLNSYTSCECSASYDWLVTVANNTWTDAWLFLHPHIMTKEASAQAAGGFRPLDVFTVADDQMPSYSRDDFAEVEPFIARTFFMLVSRYIEGLEDVETSTMSFSQKQCVTGTLTCVRESFMPSFREQVCSNLFLGDYKVEDWFRDVNVQIDQLRNRFS